MELGLEEVLKRGATQVRFWGAMMDVIRKETRHYKRFRRLRFEGGHARVFEEKRDLDLALERLSPRELDVLLSVLHLGEDCSEVAARWGVHKSRATRVFGRAVVKVRAHFGEEARWQPIRLTRSK